MLDTIQKDRRLPGERPDYSSDIGKGIRGMKFGVPREYLSAGLDEEVKTAFLSAVGQLEDMGAEVEFFSMKTTEYVVPTYYIIASAEASSNLERFDGVKYGYRASACEGLHDMYKKTRTEGFGQGVHEKDSSGIFCFKLWIL